VSEIFLSNEVLIYLLSESVIYVLILIAALLSLQLIIKWDFGSYSEIQFTLEKRAYLVMTIITFAFIVKIATLPYFAYGIDKLSDLVPGAMCASGVIGANEYGYPLLGLKIATVFISGTWIIINNLDLQSPNYPFFRIKTGLFLLIAILISIELFLDFTYFGNITTTKPVSCCSVTFGQQGGSNPLPFGLDTTKLLVLFYLFYFMTAISAIGRYAATGFVANVLFLITAYYAVVYFFGTYIYELPTHKCPFCMLQKEYYYVGYLVWASLFSGTFFGINSLPLKWFAKKDVLYTYKFSLFFNTLFVLLVSAYVLVYYLKNGVWL